MTGHQQRPPDFRWCPDSASSLRHSGARASAREPGIPHPGPWLSIPGPALTRRPGMTPDVIRDFGNDRPDGRPAVAGPLPTGGPYLFRVNWISG